MDRQSSDCSADDRHWMGDAAASIYSPALRGGNAWPAFFTLISGIVYVADGVRQLQAEGHAHPQRG